MTAATAFVWDGESPIPMSEWGKDHWSTLAYVETRCVDHDGKLDGDKMRCNWRLHRTLIGRMQLQAGMNGEKYPTRLRQGDVLGHDDWSCLEDMVSAGLLTWTETVEFPGVVFGGTTVTVNLTETGTAIAQQLRHHKASGGSFADFMPDPVPA